MMTTYCSMTTQSMVMRFLFGSKVERYHEDPKLIVIVDTQTFSNNVDSRADSTSIVKQQPQG